MTATPPPRRSHRLRERTSDRGDGRRPGPVIPLVVILVAAGLLGWSTIRSADPEPAPPSATELPLTRADLTCPAVGAADLPAARAGVGMTSLASGGSQAGAIEVQPLPKGEPLTPRGGVPAGEWTVLTQDPDASEPVLVAAEGPMAAGASAAASTTADEPTGGGLAVADCTRPTREAWFVGAGSTIDHESTLLVSNPGETEAVVDVSLLTKEGSLEPASTSGLVLSPREVERLTLTEFAAGEGEVVIHVRATQGQVAAAVLDHWTSTLAPAGTEWIPSGQSPDTSLTLSPLADEVDGQELILGNPGDRTTVVDIQVVGPDGTHPIQDFEDASVGEGSVEVVRVPESVADDMVALRLDSDQPIVASVRSTSSGNPPDIAYAPSVPEVTGPAIVPVDLPGIDPSDVRLAVTSADPAGEASLSIEAFAANGRSVAEGSLTVPAGATVTWRSSRRQDLDADPDRVAYLVVTPQSGTLRSGVVYTGGDSALAALPLASIPSVVLAPGVYPVE
jgi:hypothetical protein